MIPPDQANSMGCDANRRPIRAPIHNELRYREPSERVREMSADEARRFWSTLRPDYHPICRFYLLSGRRRSEVVGLARSDIDLVAKKVRFAIRKKRQLTKVAKTLTASQATIIKAELEKTTGPAVFTYVVQRGPDKGQRRPITEMGLKTEIRRALKAAGITDFRIHDMHHTFASALLRASGGNFALVQKALDHSDIKSTLRYAHVLDEDVVAGIEKLEGSQNYPGVATELLSETEEDTVKSND